MEIHPWDDVIQRAREHMNKGASVYQQFECENCHTKQTMPEPDKFWTRGMCEECGHITNIQKAGMNYMLIQAYGPPPA